MININNKNLCEYCFAETDREPCPKCGFSREKYKKNFSDLEVGSVLKDHYIIGGVIGKGGFGITYLAYDRNLERKVAIKEYYPNGLAVRNIGSTIVSAVNEESTETFQGGADKFYEEARLMAKFNDNPNIVSVYDCFYGNDTVYFTMGFLRGQTLKAYIKEYGVLSSGQAVCVAGDITNALIAAHHLNVLHRDISPDNIMVCSDGTVKLLDFGAARQVLTEGSQSLSVILKQGFAPLEQYQKRGKQGPWTDIYALGATLYYALTLDLLDDPMSRLYDDSEYSSNIHGIEEPLWEVIRKATMLDASERYHDIHELKAALDVLSIQPVRLAIPAEAVNDIKFKEPVQPKPEPVSEPEPEPFSEQENAGNVGETTPLLDDVADVTMPLEDSAGAVGETMALQEDAAAAGITVPLENDMPKQPKPQPEERSESKSVLLGKLRKRRVMVAGICAFILIGAAGVFFWQYLSRNSDYSDYYLYSSYSDHIEITSYAGEDTEIEIPSEIDGKPVTEIGESAFKDCSNLNSITIPDSVTEIGGWAFLGCDGLSSITIPGSVTEIREYAFLKCSSLRSIIIPDSVTKIGDGAFRKCSSLSSITIPDSVTEIGYEAFIECKSLSSIIIPDSVTEIGYKAFCDCESLSSITISGSVTKIGYEVFYGCESLRSIIIPDSVTEIGNYAFGYCSSLSSLTIPDSVTKISKGAFIGCSSLSSLTIPDSVTEIGRDAFRKCSSLSSLTIPDSVTEIGDWTFEGCSSLRSLTIPNSLTKIGYNAFEGCSNNLKITRKN